MSRTAHHHNKYPHKKCPHKKCPWLGAFKATIPRAKAVVVLLAPFIVLALSGGAAAGPPGPGAGPPPLVGVTTVTVQDVNPPEQYVGHVEAMQAVDLRARVEGFLEKVNFEEGDDVRAGDLLYVIERLPYQARVDADKARVAQAQAELGRSTAHLKRLRAARAESVPATDIDNAVAAELRARAQLAEARATLARSELDLEYTTVKAPITGRIGRTAYTKGNLVGPTSGPLARIVQLDPIRVVYSISENNLAAIQMALHEARKGKKSPLLRPRLKLANGKIFKTDGHLDFVDNKVDPATGTIAIRALFNNHDHMLLPGQYITVLVSQSNPERMPVVPQAAVLVNQQGRFVLLVDKENRAIARPITTGPAIASNWAVESGLTAGDKVIVQGIQKVRPGQTVQIDTGTSRGR